MSSSRSPSCRARARTRWYASSTAATAGTVPGQVTPAKPSVQLPHQPHRNDVPVNMVADGVVELARREAEGPE
eukprot:11158843-Lingulodinium_polyedra.AAC.1